MKEFIAVNYEATSVFSEELQTRFYEHSRFEQEVRLDMGHDYSLQI